jgi:hypothetical protein
MSTSTPAKLARLRAFLSTKPDLEVLRIYLRKQDVGLLKDAMLVTAQRVWSANAPYHLTEIGITTYDRRQVNQGQPIIAGPHAENLLRSVWCMHLRIRPHAHIPPATGNADSFHFGATTFVSTEEAMDLLHQIWHQPLDENDLGKGLRPIIYMYFGGNDGLGKMRKTTFDFDPSNCDTTVAVLDAQNIPVQAKITRSPHAGLNYLLQQFKIVAFDHENGGNTAVYSTIVAISSALRTELYSSISNPRAKAGQTGQSSSKSAQSVLQWLMERPTPPAPFGIVTYCSRCGSGAHLFTECPNTDLGCSRCERSSHVWRRNNANTHIEGLCVFRN